MSSSKRKFLAFSIVIGVGITITMLFYLGKMAKAAAPPPLSAADEYIVLSWNDLGMHCYNRDFTDLAVLPPYNNLYAQVVRRGDPPQIVTTGITVTYGFADNTYSVGKSNFWTYAQQLFGLLTPLPADIGLTGKGLSGNMVLAGDHFHADGIPLTEFSDSAPTAPDPYQLATVRVLDKATKEILTQASVVAPVSTEMRCDECHSDTGEATVGEITPTGKVETNILTLHDQEHIDEYPMGHRGALMDRRPVLCASCHSSNALGAPGVAGLPNLSRAMHSKHAEEGGFPADTSGCYKCHPGPTTRCLRDVMSQQFSFTCITCHGNLSTVAQNSNPWLNEPRCDTCHGVPARQDQALYRQSKGHNGVYCEGCHDSTHAIATSREARDAIKFISLQGHAGTLDTCTVCHITQPTVPFEHTMLSGSSQIYLPYVSH
jgi:hypothetical protein